MKKFCIFILTLIMSLSTAATVMVAASSTQTTGDWVGCVNNYGVETTADGLSIVYNGYYTAALNDGYIALNAKIQTLKESIYGDNGATQEGLMNFAFLSTSNVEPDWSNTYDGLYMHVRNIGGKLYLKLFVKSALVSGGYKDLYEQTTDVNIGDVESVVLQKEETGYSFFVNGVEYAHENFTAVTHGAMCDTSGKTYFAYASYNYPDDADRKFLFKGIVNEKPSESEKTCDCCDDSCTGDCICESGSACNPNCTCGGANCNPTPPPPPPPKIPIIRTRSTYRQIRGADLTDNSA